MWLKLLLISIFGCSKTLTSSFDLGGVISGNYMAGVPLGRSLGDGEVDVEGVCTESGVACQNCTHAITCVLLPMGWLKVPLEECLKEQTCNAHAGGCGTVPAPQCDVAAQKYQHTCEQVGIFPDAFDCRKFHLCSPPEGMPNGRPADHREALCPRNYGYNPSTAQCSIKLNKGQCADKPVPDCTKMGDHGALPASPNHYYVCLSKRGVLYPRIFICPHGWFFWGGFCRPEPPIPEPTESSTIKEDKVSVTEEVTTEKSTTERYSIHDALFATEKASTYKPDTFLADRLGISENYDVPAQDEWPSVQDDYPIEFGNSGSEFNSWEST